MAKTNKGRKLFATTATAALVASAIVPVASAAQVNDFNSIASYAQEAVQDLVDRGVVQGDANGNFQPRKSVSRAEAATVLSKALGLTTTDAIYFTDVKSDAWYYDAINAAVNNRVFSGKGQGKFDPNGNLTRGEAAVILVSAFKLNGKAPLAQFADEKSVKEWAKESLEIAVGNGVVKGDNGRIKANDAITKQDFAVMFARAEAAAETVATHTVNAINNTTVEVTFENAIDDIKALDFKIDGLEVKNAAIKQTDKKTAILTTAAQQSGKEYTVTVNGESVGKFTGVAAVLPTKIEITTQSQKAIVGQEVTVKAQVTVAEGQSKANIPVTFLNVPSTTGSDVATNVKEALTDENGVASYTYTRYYGGEDTVSAYATGKTDVRAAAGKVYWGINDRLTVTEVTEGNDLQNGSKKVYKVKATAPAGGALANAYVNIAFEENNNVTPDKGVSGVTVLDANGVALGYPYQYTTSAKRTVSIKLNASGEATFTLTGAGESVTPIVYVDATSAGTATENATAALDANELQVKLPKLTFAAVQNVEVAVESLGTAEAAALQGATNTGGRDYVVTAKTKDGKVLPEGTPIHVTLNANYKGKVYLVNSDGNTVGQEFTTSSAGVVSVKNLTVGKNGQVKFTLTGENTGFAQPIVFVDNNNNGVLNTTDAQGAGEYVYFGEAKVTSSQLIVREAASESSNIVTSLVDTQDAYFHYQITDQNGKKNISKSTTVTYEVTNNGALPITVAGRSVAAFGGKLSFSQQTNANGHDVVVVDGAGAGTVTINASASHATISNTSATVTFTNTNELANPYTGTITHLDPNTNKKLVSFDSQTGKAVSYKGATINYASRVLTEGEFESLLDTHQVTAKYSKDANGIVTIDVLTATANPTFTNVAASTNKAFVTGINPTFVDTDNDGIVDAGETITFAVTFTENVTDANVPNLLLNVNGTTARKATYTSGTGTKTLVYTYTATAGDSASDVTVTGLDLASGVTTVDATASKATGVAVDLAGPSFARANVTSSADSITINFGEKLYTAANTELATTVDAAKAQFAPLDSATTVTYNGSGSITINFSAADLLAIRSGKVVTFTGTPLLDEKGNAGATKAITLAWNFVNNTIDVVGITTP